MYKHACEKFITNPNGSIIVHTHTDTHMDRVYIFAKWNNLVQREKYIFALL